MPKELADSKKELTEKHEMLEKTTMLGTRLGALVHLGLMSSGSPRTNKRPFKIGGVETVDGCSGGLVFRLSDFWKSSAKR